MMRQSLQHAVDLHRVLAAEGLGCVAASAVWQATQDVAWWVANDGCKEGSEEDKVDIVCQWMALVTAAAQSCAREADVAHACVFGQGVTQLLGSVWGGAVPPPRAVFQFIVCMKALGDMVAHSGVEVEVDEAAGEEVAPYLVQAQHIGAGVAGLLPVAAAAFNNQDPTAQRSMASDFAAMAAVAVTTYIDNDQDGRVKLHAREVSRALVTCVHATVGCRPLQSSSVFQLLGLMSLLGEVALAAPEQAVQGGTVHAVIAFGNLLLEHYHNEHSYDGGMPVLPCSSTAVCMCLASAVEVLQHCAPAAGTGIVNAVAGLEAAAKMLAILDVVGKTTVGGAAFYPADLVASAFARAKAVKQAMAIAFQQHLSCPRVTTSDDAI